MRLGKYFYYPRKLKKETKFYYYFYDETGKKITKSTKCNTEEEIINHITDLLIKDRIEQKQKVQSQVKFEHFAKDFFKWPSSQYVLRLLTKKKSIKHTTAKFR